MSAGDHIATIEFTDRDSGDEAMAFVRCVDRLIAIGLVVKENGDLDIALEIGRAHV